MKKAGQVHLEAKTNSELDKISKLRRGSDIVAWRKKDIVAELITKEYKRSFK